MALPSVLSEKGLAKFRTKLCERLLATGTCTFGDKCQYSHAERPRRNPHKVCYVAQRCGNADGCELGAACSFAHTRDEELYHPTTYKTVMCNGGNDCGGYYCSMAHTADELRVRDHGGSQNLEASIEQGSREYKETPIEGGTGGTPCVEVDDAINASARESESVLVTSRNSAQDDLRQASTEFALPLHAPRPESILQSLIADVDSWWVAGDQNDLRVCVNEVTHSPSGDGDALIGGILRPGIFSGKSQSSRQHDREVRCQVKLLTISRGDSAIAAQVVKEAKRWIIQCSSEGANSSHGAFVLRRTVATTVLALPEWASTLGQSLRKLKFMKKTPAQQATAEWSSIVVLASWARQLITQVKALHVDGITHLCLGPQTITIDARGDIHVGDFMGKIRALCLLENGWKGSPDDDWAMWYPAEVHRRVSRKDQNIDASINCYAVDSWQLGVSLFYMLTGEHPFGNCSEPGVVCANINHDRRVNRPLLDHLPLFADLVSRLTERRPEQRLTPTQACKHPVLWNEADAFKFALPILPAAQTTRSGGWAWLQHIPPLAAYVKSSVPVDAGCKGEHGFLTFVCEKATGTDGGCFSPNLDEQIGLESLAARAEAHAANTTSARAPVSAVWPRAETKAHASESAALNMALPLLPKTTQEFAPAQGTSLGIAEAMAAPPGLEEFVARTHLVPAASHHSDLPLLGTEPRPFVSSASNTNTSVSSLSQFQGHPTSLTSTRPRQLDASEGRRGVTGIVDGSLGLVNAIGHAADINHILPLGGFQPSLLDYYGAYPTVGSDAVLAPDQYPYGLPTYLQLPGYLQNLTWAQQAALERQRQEAWARHYQLLQSRSQLSSSLPDSLFPPGALSPSCSTPDRSPSALLGLSISPTKQPRPIAAVDVLTLLENGVVPSFSESQHGVAQVQCQLARLPDPNAKALDSRQDASQELDCLPVDLLQAMESQSGRNYRTV